VIGTLHLLEAARRHGVRKIVFASSGGANGSVKMHQLAKYLNVPDEIQRRTPTTDTYPGGSTQEEFVYRVPFDILDTVWLGNERGLPPAEIAQALDLSAEQVQRIIADIASKQRATAYLRLPPIHAEVNPSGRQG
jgi:NAD+ synthase